MANQKPMIIAHRGASGEAPENTLAAFALGIEQECTGIELDIHVSKDGALIVCHDATIDRTTNGTGAIAEMTVKELQQFDAGGWFHEKYAGERLPLLEEVYALTPAHIPINVEIKSYGHPDVNRLLSELLRRLGRVESTFVSSFHHESLLALKKLNPDMKIGLLYQKESPDYNAMIAEHGPVLYSLHPHHKYITPEYMAAAQAAGLQVYPWTINDEAGMQSALAAGVSGIITNYPAVMKRLVD